MDIIGDRTVVRPAPIEKGEAMDDIDVGLFEKARDGDREAFWQVIAPYRGLIYSVARGMVGAHERCEDLLHDILLVAYQALPRLKDPSRLSSWLYGVTRNHIMEVARREQRLRRATMEQGAQQTHVAPVIELLEREQWLADMDEALTRLPEPFRVILALKYTNDYSCREISEILDLSVSAVKSRLFEARKLLRKKMAALSNAKEAPGHAVR